MVSRRGELLIEGSGPTHPRGPYRAAVLVLGCAACTGAGGAPAPTTGSLPAPTAGTFKGGINPTTKFTQLTATLLTTPGPVEMSDAKVHLADELILDRLGPGMSGAVATAGHHAPGRGERADLAESLATLTPSSGTARPVHV